MSELCTSSSSPSVVRIPSRVAHAPRADSPSPQYLSPSRQNLSQPAYPAENLSRPRYGGRWPYISTAEWNSRPPGFLGGVVEPSPPESSHLGGPSTHPPVDQIGKRTY
ncbi:hypothetical protein LIER_09459 [Lithospermum erythrorhizon]|uniref:Uncharacterized protein n=1 Tax=Lithospermum erythrorhizon TaxID=34254 RepID=A0AAV3PFV1_LITER